MKLLIVTQKVNTNDGNLSFFHRWIEEFASKVDAVDVLCLEMGSHNLPDNVSVTSLGKERGASKALITLHFLSYIISTRKDYDLVFVHMNPIYLAIGGFIWAFLGKPMYLWYTHRNVDLKLRIASLFVKKIFTAVPESCRIAKKKVVALGHGVDVNHFNMEKKPFGTPLRLLHVGRITPIKNCDVLIDALGILREHGTQAEIHFVGEAIYKEDKKYKKKLEKQIRKKDLGPFVHFDGAIPYNDLPSVAYAPNDILVNLTPTGGWDKVVLEAYACNRYALTTNDAYKSFFGEYTNQGIVSFNDPKELALKISALQIDSVMLTDLHTRVGKKYGLNSMIDSLLSEMNYVRD